MYWQDKNILVMGFGITGKSMISYLRKRGARVYIYDDKKGIALPQIGEWLSPDRVDVLRDIDLVAVSPGFAPTHPIISMFSNKGVPIWGDLEIAYKDREKKDWIAITGTNGKTTTTMLVDHILRKLGVNSQTFGNIGVPVLDAVSFEGIPVVEVSSFQLEYVEEFHPHVGVFLNLTPDHLNRHGTMEGYFQAKMTMFATQDSDDYAIFNADDPWGIKGASLVKSRLITFSQEKEDATVFFKDGYIYVEGRKLWDITGSSRFLYPPYLEDLLGALSAVIALGYEEAIRDVSSAILSDFVFARHRMEEVATINGVVFINDSKATNVASTLAAIRGFEGGKLLLILGGSRKDTTYDELAKEIKSRSVKHVALIGETGSEIKDSLDKVGYRSYTLFSTLEEAVQYLWQIASAGDVVLLSPACASFDMFKNYKHRGDTFVQIVEKLADSNE